MDDLGLRYLEHLLIKHRTVEFRLYQKHIAETAFEGNTLVILPTALGKTIIAVIVAADVLLNYRSSRVLVLAPTRPLVAQHRDTFMKFLRLRDEDVFIVTGETPPARREEIWLGGARLFFSTPQVVRNDLQSGRLSLEGFGLVVFDECHRAVKRYAYTEIARAYAAQAGYPLILGMTASPGSERERVLEVCRNLFIEHIEHRSEEDPDVKPYIQSIEMEWMSVELPMVYRAARAQIRSMLDRRLLWLHRWGVVRGKPPFVFRRELIEAGHVLRYDLEVGIPEERGRMFSAILNQSLALTLHHMLELLETQGMSSLRAFMEKVVVEKGGKRTYSILAKDPKFVGLRDLVERSLMEHPKVGLLKGIVAGQVEGGSSSRVLVFTQYRDTASHLVEVLSGVPGVRVDRFVGQASRPGDAGLSQEEQVERIRMLREGELNVLVATSIAEEGLDIPTVDHVVFYEPIPSEIRVIQRRGRTGRSAAGKVTILAAEGTMDMAYLRAGRRRAERMRRVVEGANSMIQGPERRVPRPTPDPLPPSYLRSLEGGCVEGPSESEITIIDDEPEIFVIPDGPDESRSRVEEAARSIYTKLVERGIPGANVDRLAFELERERVPSLTFKAALEKLTREKRVTESAIGRYLATSALKTMGKSHVVTVEKIRRGYAVVDVDEKLKARLIPEDYEGPRWLLKKNSRFKAASSLYSYQGALYIRVSHVTRILQRTRKSMSVCRSLPPSKQAQHHELLSC